MLLGLVLLGPVSLPVSAETLDVFAAASLTEAFRELATTFETAHPDIRVSLAFAGSQSLALQISQGAPADIYASADLRWMEHLQKERFLLDEPVIFARNHLVVIVPRENPGRVDTLGDLTRPGLLLVVADPSVPLGAYTRTALAQLSETDVFPADFSARVLANAVSLEENVKSVVSKVVLGEADAGIVYRSDVTQAVREAVRTLEIPECCNPAVTYPIAVLRESKRPELARAFLDSVLGPRGQAILTRHGLLPR